MTATIDHEPTTIRQYERQLEQRETAKLEMLKGFSDAIDAREEMRRRLMKTPAEGQISRAGEDGRMVYLFKCWVHGGNVHLWAYDLEDALQLLVDEYDLCHPDAYPVMAAKFGR